METEINIVEILKDKPANTKLYSPLFSEVLFSENRSVVHNGIPSTTMGFVAIDLDANTYKD